MAGSYRHCVDDDGKFQGIDLLDDLGDALEALEEMYGMIWWLAAGAPDLVEQARQKYREGIALSPTKAGKADAAPGSAGPAVVPRCVFWEDGEHCFSEVVRMLPGETVARKACACGAMVLARQPRGGG